MTPDDDLTDLPDEALYGAPDPWNHDGWVTAWGYNAPLIVGETAFRLPKAPDGMCWLLTRLLVGGRRVMELSLVRLGEDRIVTTVRVRVAPEPVSVADRACQILQEIPG